MFRLVKISFEELSIYVNLMRDAKIARLETKLVLCCVR